MGQDARLGQLHLSEAPWPVDTSKYWPPYVCHRCGAMKFYYNTNMAQCFYCANVSLNWSRFSQGS